MRRGRGPPARRGSRSPRTGCQLWRRPCVIVHVDGKRLRLPSAIAVSVVLALAGPSAAAAATCLPDQTVAVLDQYCETPLSLIGVPAPSDAKRGAAKSLSLALPPAE